MWVRGGDGGEGDRRRAHAKVHVASAGRLIAASRRRRAAPVDGAALKLKEDGWCAAGQRQRRSPCLIDRRVSKATWNGTGRQTGDRVHKSQGARPALLLLVVHLH